MPHHNALPYATKILADFFDKCNKILYKWALKMIEYWLYLKKQINLSQQKVLYFNKVYQSPSIYSFYCG